MALMGMDMGNGGRVPRFRSRPKGHTQIPQHFWVQYKRAERLWFYLVSERQLDMAVDTEQRTDICCTVDVDVDWKKNADSQECSG